jgi:hypothetical protein
MPAIYISAKYLSFSSLRSTQRDPAGRNRLTFLFYRLTIRILRSAFAVALRIPCVRKPSRTSASMLESFRRTGES